MTIENAGSGTKGKLISIHEALIENIVSAAIEVHRILGPGLLQPVYERALCHELTLRNIRFQQHVPVSLSYKGMDLECGYRVDILVEDAIILEVKSVAGLLSVHEAQLLSYLKFANKPVGFVMNFNVPVLKDGIVRRTL